MSVWSIGAVLEYVCPARVPACTLVSQPLESRGLPLVDLLVVYPVLRCPSAPPPPNQTRDSTFLAH
eukprot:928241-Rhodomonas_salina.1